LQKTNCRGKIFGRGAEDVGRGAEDVGRGAEDVGRGAEDEPQVNDHKSVGRKVSGMVEAVPRSVGVSWSSGSYSVKSTAEDEPKMKAE
jgi:hypothetical protein